MTYGRFALHLTKRIFAALLAVGLLLPAICPAFVVKTAAAGRGATAKLTAQATGIQAPVCSASPTGATITLPTPTILPGTSNGPIGTAASVTVAFNCLPAFDATPNYYDDFTVLTGQFAPLDPTTPPPGGSGIMFQTNVPGIDVLLTASTNQASSGNNGPNGTVGWAVGTTDCTSATGGATGSCSANPFSATFTARLVKIGPVSPGTITSIQMLQFFDSDYTPPPPANNPPYINTVYSLASPEFGTLTLNPVTVSMSTCSVTSSSKNISVILPTITTAALPSTGSVAEKTAFTIDYSCPAGWSLYMTMATANPGTPPGVVLSPGTCAAGTPATNIGVQLLQSNQQPVQFNAAQSLGSSLSGTLALTYYAEYYATGSPVGAGAVCGTATFTMSYQ